MDAGFHQIGDVTVKPDQTGTRRFTKVSYPIRYGRYAEIRTSAYTFQFNLNHEIKYIQGRGNGWPSPVEWLKRTVGNDWVYYLAGDYSGVRDAFGEYYLPCPFYSTNTFISRNPFDDRSVITALAAWENFRKNVSALASNSSSGPVRRFLQSVEENNATQLARKARHLHGIINGRVTVLPPDTRHVDYEVIPVIIADGCLYKCGFCRVKSRENFMPRSRRDIVDQIKRFREFFGPDIRNYNAVFLGLHDALAADPGLILFAAKKAYDLLGLKDSYLENAHLFFFGSVDAIIATRMSFFEALQSLPYSTWINIGLESADRQTLEILKKPISPGMVDRAFAKMLAINKRFSNIEITANFVYSDHLPSGHLPSFFELARKNIHRPGGKGTVYFSPLMNGKGVDGHNIVRKFYKIKTQSPLPCYLYLIQRL